MLDLEPTTTDTSPLETECPTISVPRPNELGRGFPAPLAV
jgi:hypothetical protein